GGAGRPTARPGALGGPRPDGRRREGAGPRGRPPVAHAPSPPRPRGGSAGPQRERGTPITTTASSGPRPASSPDATASAWARLGRPERSKRCSPKPRKISGKTTLSPE